MEQNRWISGAIQCVFCVRTLSGLLGATRANGWWKQTSCTSPIRENCPFVKILPQTFLISTNAPRYVAKISLKWGEIAWNHKNSLFSGGKMRVFCVRTCSGLLCATRARESKNHVSWTPLVRENWPFDKNLLQKKVLRANASTNLGETAESSREPPKWDEMLHFQSAAGGHSCARTLSGLLGATSPNCLTYPWKLTVC